MTDTGQHTQPYSETGFWQKLKTFAVHAGREVVEKALILYFAAQRPETPIWAKTIIYSALAYFILPTDAIPDFIPLTGFTDDLTTLIAALSAVALCITPEVQARAKQQVNDWFGEAPPDAPAAANPTQADHPLREIQID